MDTFTVIFDYAGGTYISQIKARNCKQACQQWAAQFDPRVIKGFGKSGFASLLAEIEEEQPVLLTGLKNVWCITALVRNKLGTIHIVQTEI